MPSTRDASTDAALGEPLDRLAAIAAQAAAERIASEARELAERVAGGLFYVACVGQFKRGKSTLLNALVEDRILPTGIIPITTAPTVLRYGARRAARVRSAHDGWCDIDPDTIKQSVSEEYNSENEKGIEAVEVFLPAPVLASGLCLVDTPGLGSVFAANTAATHAFVPHIDAALVVIGTEPPLAGEELALVEVVAREVHDLLIVLNKADRVSDAERATAVAFARRTIERRLGRPAGRIYEVSAIERLNGATCPTRDWRALVDALDELVCHSGRALVRSAQERGLTRLSDQLLTRLDTERGALIRPIEESERRVATLGATIADAEQAVEDLATRVQREQHRLSSDLSERREVLLRAVIPTARTELMQVLSAQHRRWGPTLRREAMDAAQDIAQRHVSPWLAAEQTYAENAYRRIALRFVEMANEFLDRLATTGDVELAYLPKALDPEHGVRAGSGFYFHDLLRIAHPASPLRYTLDVGHGVVGARSPMRRAADRFLVRLLAVNAARVENDLEQRLSESRRQLEADIRLLLRDVCAAAESALARARLARESGAAAVADALARVARQGAAIRALRAPPPEPAAR